MEDELLSGVFGKFIAEAVESVHGNMRVEKEKTGNREMLTREKNRIPQLYRMRSKQNTISQCGYEIEETQ